MSEPSSERNAIVGGAKFLPSFAKHLDSNPNSRTLNKLAGDNEQYVLVHMYLSPGVEFRESRTELRASIWTALQHLHPVQLHTDAFAVPCFRSSPAETANLVWLQLNVAGVIPEASGQQYWRDGDVVYLHYVDECGMHATASAPLTGQALKIP